MAVEKGLKMAANLCSLWLSSKFVEKQKLQYLIFPSGIMYNKKNNTVRTNEVNSIFAAIASQHSIS
jgi:hypothetical protein